MEDNVLSKEEIESLSQKYNKEERKFKIKVLAISYLSFIVFSALIILLIQLIK